MKRTRYKVIENTFAASFANELESFCNQPRIEVLAIQYSASATPYGSSNSSINKFFTALIEYTDK